MFLWIYLNIIVIIYKKKCRIPTKIFLYIKLKIIKLELIFFCKLLFKIIKLAIIFLQKFFHANHLFCLFYEVRTILLLLLCGKKLNKSGSFATKVLIVELKVSTGILTEASLFMAFIKCFFYSGFLRSLTILLTFEHRHVFTPESSRNFEISTDEEVMSSKYFI